MESKIILITGANSGIGKATATALSEMGAHVVMLSRNLEKGERARQEVIRSSKNHQVDLMECDLASMSSIRSFASAFIEKYPRLDVLINNAGIFTDKRMVTKDGFEYQIGVNHLGHFLLTRLLLDFLKKSSPSRIINVSSGAHFGGDIDFEDFQMEKRYSSWKAYSQSKLANILFTYELAHRLAGTGVTGNCLHPGFVNTRFAFDRTTEKPHPMMLLAKPFTISPAAGAETSVYLAASPEVEGVTGKYFVKRKEKASSRASYDLIKAEKLWNLSMMLCGM
ncbi:MAG: SDR family oxidoreductase [Bacteroidales bacterium]|jgi:NAD(P)-dependent dehydrogenase (short-subunit alcohol dehydrogenase family)